MHNIIHGANPENLYHAFNIPVPAKILDFSTNTNILEWPDVRIDIEHLASSYPDPDCSRLREIISIREDISPSRILFTNGINEAIFLLADILHDDTAILEPSYPEYSRAFRKLHSAFTLDEALSFTNIIIINPNNPTGKFIQDLSKTIADNPGKIFIIDEAYIDFLLWKIPERLCEFPNVILLRSLTKIFHLSGARIGYVIAGEEIIERLKERQPSWSVNAVAQELALCFLKEEGFIERTREFYRRASPEFMGMLRDTGCDVMASDVHFFLVRVNDDEEIMRRLLVRGIAVRHTRNFAGLGGGYIRVATRWPSENERLITAMKEVMA